MIDVAERRDAIMRVPMRSESARILRDHWLAIAEDRLVPAKADLDPSRMKSALPQVLIHEFENRDMIRFRLFGTGLYSAYKRDLTGTNYLDYVGEKARRTTSERLHVVLERPCGLLTTVVAPWGRELNVLHETMGLPLADRDGLIRFMIYTTDPLTKGVTEKPERRAFLNAEKPQYFDIGAGVPEVPEVIL